MFSLANKRPTWQRYGDPLLHNTPKDRQLPFLSICHNQPKSDRGSRKAVKFKGS